MIEGFFFDLDGTLVNTYEADYLAYRDAVYEVAGVDLVQAKFAALHGIEIGAKLTRLVPGLSDKQVKAIRESKKRQYLKYLHLTKANKALIRFMVQFAEHQATVLVTTAKRDNTDALLAHHDLKRFFTHIVCGDDVTEHKPHPEPYLMALDMAGIAPANALAFEDSQTGIQSAQAAGIAVVHVKEFSVL